MQQENRINQHYAVTQGGILIHINEAHNNTEECFCPHCGCRMLKRCGNIRTWHFAHDYRYNNECNKTCSYESYLHAFAKLRIKQWFEESDSIIIHYSESLVCKFIKDCIWKEGNECSHDIEKTLNLKKYLTQCKIEESITQNNDRFRADLLWTNPSKPNNDILIEIKVTHKCSEKKKQSNKRIIEFDVHSEEDVENIVTNDIKECETVRFYGFNPKDIVYKEMEPLYVLNKFNYYYNGKAFAGVKCDCYTYRKRLPKALLEITIKNKELMQDESSERQVPKDIFSFGRFHNWGVAFARSKKSEVKNCCLCIHYDYDYDKKAHTCNLNLNNNYNSFAITCRKFLLNEKHFQKFIEEFEEFQKNHKVDIYYKS